jgi:hypothetical protein
MKNKIVDLFLFEIKLYLQRHISASNSIPRYRIGIAK